MDNALLKLIIYKLTTKGLNFHRVSFNSTNIFYKKSVSFKGTMIKFSVLYSSFLVCLWQHYHLRL
uniref:Uncharacterized protein n=1 Tax=Lepeophtheirus salmonis TaxID=72036 RepID=A0A0K2U4F3_LEPSM